MRITVPLVIEMSDEQVQRWADDQGLRTEAGKVTASTIKEDVRSYVHTAAAGYLDGYANVTIKR